MSTPNVKCFEFVVLSCTPLLLSYNYIQSAHCITRKVLGKDAGRVTQGCEKTCGMNIGSQIKCGTKF